MSVQSACLSVKENITKSELTAEPMPVSHIISSGQYKVDIGFLMADADTHIYLESRLAEIMQIITQYNLMEAKRIVIFTVK